MKNALLLCIILAIFGIMNIATKKNMEYPCETKINYLLHRNQIIRGYYLLSSHDTIVIRAFTDTGWDNTSLAICNLLSDTCNVRNYKILITDTTSDRLQWNTYYGKQIYIRQCQ